MTKATSPETRKEGVWRLTVRAQRRRSAPARLLPLIRPLLDDPEETVRSEVVHAFRRCGNAAMRYADDLSRVAARYPQTAAAPGFTPEYYAVGTLMLLGDARWVEPVCTATAAPNPGLRLDTIPAPRTSSTTSHSGSSTSSRRGRIIPPFRCSPTRSAHGEPLPPRRFRA